MNEEKPRFSAKLDINGTVNTVILIGNMGSDAELKKSASGKSFTSVSIVTNRGYKDTDGTMVKDTQWTRIECEGNQAETLASYGHKGSKLYVLGHIETKKYDNDGEVKYVTVVKVDRFQFLSPLGLESKQQVDEDPPEQIRVSADDLHYR